MDIECQYCAEEFSIYTPEDKRPTYCPMCGEMLDLEELPEFEDDLGDYDE